MLSNFEVEMQLKSQAYNELKQMQGKLNDDLQKWNSMQNELRVEEGKANTLQNQIVQAKESCMTAINVTSSKHSISSTSTSSSALTGSSSLWSASKCNELIQALKSKVLLYIIVS